MDVLAFLLLQVMNLQARQLMHAPIQVPVAHRSSSSFMNPSTSTGWPLSNFPYAAATATPLTNALVMRASNCFFP